MQCDTEEWLPVIMNSTNHFHRSLKLILVLCSDIYNGTEACDPSADQATYTTVTMTHSHVFLDIWPTNYSYWKGLRSVFLVISCVFLNADDI